LRLDSDSAALSEIHEELQHQLQPVIEPFVKRKYVDFYHAKTQRIVTKWLNGAYPNHVIIRQSHNEKKPTIEQSKCFEKHGAKDLET
jgi:hypothetical protein